MILKDTNNLQYINKLANLIANWRDVHEYNITM